MHQDWPGCRFRCAWSIDQWYCGHCVWPSGTAHTDGRMDVATYTPRYVSYFIHLSSSSALSSVLDGSYDFSCLSATFPLRHHALLASKDTSDLPGNRSLPPHYLI